MLGAVWFYYMCKLIELLDTVFFVLRKKQNQVTFLHVYHHTMMPFAGFIGTKYLGGLFGWPLIMTPFLHFLVKYRWSHNSPWTHQLLHSCHHVRLLYASCHGSTYAKIFVVETVFDGYANGKDGVHWFERTHLTFLCTFRFNSELSLFTQYKCNFIQVVNILKELLLSCLWMQPSSSTCSLLSTIMRMWRHRKLRWKPMVMLTDMLMGTQMDTRMAMPTDIPTVLYISLTQTVLPMGTLPMVKRKLIKAKLNFILKKLVIAK